MNPPTRVRDGRGVSAVLAVVLLTGIVAIGSVGVLIAANTATDTISQNAESERIEQSFQELGHTMIQSSLDTDGANEVNLEAGDGAIARTDTGNITLEMGTSGETIGPIEFGTIEYQGEDDTQIAYEAGGVFHEAGPDTRVISEPPIEYNAETETLSLPVFDMTGEKQLDTGGITMQHNETTTYNNISVVQDEQIELTLNSEYCQGWQNFFENSAGDTVVSEGCFESGGTDGQLVAVLGYDEADAAFDNGLVYGDTYSDFHGEIGDENTTETMLPPMDSVIDFMIDRHSSNGSTIDRGTIDGTGDELTAGTYFAEEISLTNDLDVNTSDGDVTLVVEGNAFIDATITNDANGTDNEFRIYMGGSELDAKSGGMSTVDGELPTTRQVQLYGTSELVANFQKGNFEMLLYAASNSDSFDGNDLANGNKFDDYQISIHSNPTFKGSIVSYSMNVQANANDFQYEDELANESIDIYPEDYELPPQLTYLNVAKHSVDIE